VAIAIELVSSHPLLVRAVDQILSSAADLCECALPPVSSVTEAIAGSNSPRLFLLDACSLRTDLGPLAERCRAHSPGSKFLALLPPRSDSLAEKIRLFHWGIDGFVELHEKWQAELPQAIQSVLRGQPWAPPELLLAFVTHAKALLDAQQVHGQYLTAREAQVLQLLLRRQTNKDISSALGISGRTVKFHVSNILCKLQMADRRGLTPDGLALKALTSEARADAKRSIRPVHPRKSMRLKTAWCR
jgi:two-component system response regulator DevR